MSARGKNGRYYTASTTQQESQRVLKYRVICLYCKKCIRLERERKNKKIHCYSTVFGRYVDKYGIPIPLEYLQKNDKAGFFHTRCAIIAWKRNKTKLFDDYSDLGSMLDRALSEALIINTQDCDILSLET